MKSVFIFAGLLAISLSACTKSEGPRNDSNVVNEVAPKAATSSIDFKGAEFKSERTLKGLEQMAIPLDYKEAIKQVGISCLEDSTGYDKRLLPGFHFIRNETASFHQSGSRSERQIVVEALERTKHYFKLKRLDHISKTLGDKSYSERRSYTSSWICPDGGECQSEVETPSIEKTGEDIPDIDSISEGAPLSLYNMGLCDETKKLGSSLVGRTYEVGKLILANGDVAKALKIGTVTDHACVENKKSMTSEAVTHQTIEYQIILDLPSQRFAVGAYCGETALRSIRFASIDGTVLGEYKKSMLIKTPAPMKVIDLSISSYWKNKKEEK
jgi:hypothetical protein